MVQWLGLRASTAGGTGSIPGWGSKIPQAVQHIQKKLFEIFDRLAKYQILIKVFLTSS